MSSFRCSNANLNVRDPHYSAVYGNPYLRTSLAEHSYLLTDETPELLYPSPPHDSPYPPYAESQNGGSLHRPHQQPVYGMYSVTSATAGGGGSVVPAHYIVRHDQLNSSLATHV